MRRLSEKKEVELCLFPPGDGLLQPSAAPESTYPEGWSSVIPHLHRGSKHLQPDLHRAPGGKGEGECTGDALVVDHRMAYFGDVVDEPSIKKLPRLASQY